MALVVDSWQGDEESCFGGDDYEELPLGEMGRALLAAALLQRDESSRATNE